MTVATNGVHKSMPSALPLVQKLSQDHDLVLKTFRLLIADLCQQFSGGHPGYDKDLPFVVFIEANIDYLAVVPLAWPQLVCLCGSM